MADFAALTSRRFLGGETNPDEYRHVTKAIRDGVIQFIASSRSPFTVFPNLRTPGRCIMWMANEITISCKTWSMQLEANLYGAHTDTPNPLRRNSGPAQRKPVLWRPVGTMHWTTSPSATAVAEQLGLHKHTVSACCRNNSEVALPGEEWRAQVSGKMVSSLGRMSKGILGWFAEGTKGSSGRRS